ncbi:MAG TPA: hypothetical protein VK191_17145 [Symbiobacteriaceae bacterium]|nr:hypothetical protein [Symbiobacteriaceae bacterium]
MKAPVIVTLLLLALPLGGCTTGSSQTTTAPAAAPETKQTASKAQGGTYKGKVTRGYGITFKLSANGKQITEVHADVLETCSGSSSSRTSTLFFDGPFVAGADGAFQIEGEEKEYGTQYRFTATLTGDGKAAGTILQKDANCTTYELKWEAEKQ